MFHCAKVLFISRCQQPLVSGGLFDDDTKDSELAFKFGVEAINNQRNEQSDGLLEAGEKNFNGEMSRFAY